jgi:hypothetical protein
MCIILASPSGKMPGKEVLQRCRELNRDGMGLAYVEDGRVKVSRYLTEFEEMYEEILQVRERVHDSPLIVHFRRVSAGTVCMENVHPFLLEDHNCAVAHNGTLFDWVEKGEDRSDTRRFVEDLMSGLPHDFLKQEGALLLLDSAIGASRVAVLAEDGVHLFNRSAWVEDDGIFYSNTGYLPPAPAEKKEATTERLLFPLPPILSERRREGGPCCEFCGKSVPRKGEYIAPDDKWDAGKAYRRCCKKCKRIGPDRRYKKREELIARLMQCPADDEECGEKIQGVTMSIKCKCGEWTEQDPCHACGKPLPEDDARYLRLSGLKRCPLCEEKIDDKWDRESYDECGLCLNCQWRCGSGN